MKQLIRSSLIAAAIAILSSTASAADPTCELSANGLSFFDNGHPYICNFDLTEYPFSEYTEYSGGRSDIWEHLFLYGLRAYEDGSYHLRAYNRYNRATIHFFNCGKPTWGCSTADPNPEGYNFQRTFSGSPFDR